jgi:hypothetical protein
MVGAIAVKGDNELGPITNLRQALLAFASLMEANIAISVCLKRFLLDYSRHPRLAAISTSTLRRPAIRTQESDSCCVVRCEFTSAISRFACEFRLSRAAVQKPLGEHE